MENENEKVEEIVVSFDNAEIGEDVPQIKPGTGKVISYRIDDIIDKTNKAIGKKLVLIVKQNNYDKEIEISGVQYVKDKKIKTSGLWLKLDEDGKLPFNMGVSIMLRHLNITAIKDIVGKDIMTATNEGGYLVVKAI